MRELFERFLMWACFAGIGGIAVAAFVKATLPSAAAKVKLATENAKRHGVVATIAVVLFIGGMFVYGSTKNNTQTNEPEPQTQMLLGSRRMVRTIVPQETTHPSVRALNDEDYEAGFALTRIGTNEAFNFEAPVDAEICEDWLAFGAHEDWFRSHFTNNWSFALGTNTIDALTVFSYGTARPKVRDTATFISPFETSLGIVPVANWSRLAETNTPSQFWQYLTPSNTYVMTWQNALVDRDSNCPVSFQAEYWTQGNIMFRYDLSRLPDDVATNLVVGIRNGGNGRVFSELPRGTTSLTWAHVTAEDLANPDRDGDGVSTEDELFVYHTDPDNADSDFDGVSDGDEMTAGTNPCARDTDGDGLVDGSDPNPSVATSLADLDGDGIPDAYENHWFGGTNVFNVATNRDATGFTLEGKILCGINPTNGIDAVNIVSTNALVSWKLFDRFAMDLPSNATNLVWERTFMVNRSSAWQQFFVSAAPTNAAGWRLQGAVLEWSTDTGTSGSVTASPFGDSYRVPLAADDLCSTLTLHIRATGTSTVCSPAPLYFLAYAPQFRLEGTEPITGASGTRFFVFEEGSDSVLSLVIDSSLRPSRAAQSADEGNTDDLVTVETGGVDFSYAGDISGGRLYANRPGVYTLPDWSLGVSTVSTANRRARVSARDGGGSNGDVIVVLDPSVSWKCAGHGSRYDGLGYDWDSYSYSEESYYPLDTKCLRRKWYRTWGGGWNDADCELIVSSGLGDNAPLWVTNSVSGSTGSVCVDGVTVWSGTAEHVYDGSGSAYGGEDSGEESLADECGSCEADCADGNCDALEGASLGSLKFRIPLGAPVKGQVAGFAWFETEMPQTISRDAFQLLRHPDATIVDTTSGNVRRIVCSDSRGRDLRLEDIANGVRITINETASQALEHTWEITNVGGEQSQIRLRKISRQNNVMSDETYTYADGDWTQFDNIAGVGTELTVYNDFADYGDGAKYEMRTTTDANGTVLSSVTTERSRIGECDNAVLRETYRVESTGRDTIWTQADYWNDPAHALRHGQLRLVRGNARAWVYTDFDGNGHETLRIEQRGNSPIPDAFSSGSPIAASELLHSPFSIFHSASAFVTVKSYEPFVGDSCHSDDAAKPRMETRYVVENGAVRMIARTWRRYTRLTRNGYAAIKEETWRAAAQDAAFGDDANDYSYTVTYADTGDGTPLLMRNAEAEALDENGITTISTYALTGNILSCTTRRYGPDGVTPFPTYEVTESDSSYGTVLRRTTRLTSDNAVIADEQSIYDSQNRLRSTAYLDGTSLTNAYSCCRLLWSRDREGRLTLRSAETGTDHLYYAMEDVYLADISTNGQYRVTQHFFDALGRETNTVVYAGTTPGEANSPTSTLHSALYTLSSSYPYGGSDYSIHTDERGKVTIRRSDILDDVIETGETVCTNGVEIVTTKTRSYFGGGSSTRREWDGGKFTEERRFDEYAEDGTRRAFVVTESSDCGVVTNSVTAYDFLGRVVSTSVPGANESVIVTTLTYEGATNRKAMSSTTGSPVVAYSYDACGELAATAQDGRSAMSETAYETVSGEVYRVVTTARLTGSVTNSVERRLDRLTGLSDALRARTVSVAASGRETVTERSFESVYGLLTDVSQTESETPVTTVSRYGFALERDSLDGAVLWTYDAFGRRASEIVSDAAGVTNRIDRMEYDSSGNVVRTASDFLDGRIAESLTEYDLLNRAVSTTDALGNVRTTAYDALGRTVFTGGDAYPIKTGYDTAGRKTLGGTTRDGGATWDETAWAYDAASGLNTAKEYADGSRIAYAYADNGKKTRTTWARGAWREHAYNVRNLVSGTTYSDGTPSIAYAYADSGRIASASTSTGLSYSYGYNDMLLNTNEVVIIGGGVVSIARTYDEYRRDSDTAVDITNARYAAKTCFYDSENRVCGYVLTNAAGRGVSVTFAYDGTRLTNTVYVLPDGSRFTSRFMRETARKNLVTERACAFNGQSIYSYSTEYDLLGRPTNAVDSLSASREWLYNRRSELVGAMIGTNLFDYAYDTIGNRSRASANAVTNTYSANALNQYTAVDATNFVYDADGNLTNDGRFSYAYDAENRLVSTYPLQPTAGVLAIENVYDHRHRRVKKTVKRFDGEAWTVAETRTFIWDGMNIVLEKIVPVDGATQTIEYFWGPDKSGTEQGAGGVGGLLAVSRDGVFYLPCYDHNGNIVCYVSEAGAIIAEYVYDPYGNVIEQYGSASSSFNIGFSTKYHDREIGLIGYQRRFYRPDLGRWLNRDPIEEDGGENLYAFCGNNPVCLYDKDGCAYFAYRPLGVPILKNLGVTVNFDWMDDRNVAILHEQLFFEDGGIPTNQGYFDDGLVRSDGAGIPYNPSHSRGWNDCIMRKAVAAVRPRPYSLLGNKDKGIVKYNCQDWAEEVRQAYFVIRSGKAYHPWGYTEMRAR